MVHCNPSIIIRSASFLFSPIRPISSTSIHSVLLGLQRSYLINSVHIGPIRPIHPLQFIWYYLVHFGPIRFTLVLFGPFGLLWSYSVHIGPILSIESTLVHFNLFGIIRFTSVLFDLLWSYSVHYIIFSPFGPLWSYLVHVGPIWFIQSTLVLFGPFVSSLIIRTTLVQFVYLVYINIRSNLVRLNLSESFSKHKDYEHRNVIFRVVTHLF